MQSVINSSFLEALISIGKVLVHGWLRIEVAGFLYGCIRLDGVIFEDELVNDIARLVIYRMHILVLKSA
jgi:hypothetical protein